MMVVFVSGPSADLWRSAFSKAFMSARDFRDLFTADPERPSPTGPFPDTLDKSVKLMGLAIELTPCRSGRCNE